MKPADCEVTVYIGVGSNIDPEENISKALELLGIQARITDISTFYWTEPVGPPGQPQFLNGVCALRTNIAPETLKFEVLRPIEARLGRVRTNDKFAPRTIDLDILLYGDRVIAAPGLSIPDPDLRERPFLVQVLTELAPDAVLPGTGTPIAQPFSRNLQARFSTSGPR